MDEFDVMIFDIFYKWTPESVVDYTRIRAEDEVHAYEKFLRAYPGVEIVNVVCRGAAF